MINDLMPCGKKDCTECESCKYDLPLDASIFKIKYKEMKNFGLVPVGDNPSTAQIIIPGALMRHNIIPIGKETQLALPFKDDACDNKKSPYCNGCEFFLKIQRPNKSTYNTRCKAETSRPGGSERVIKLNVYPNEKVNKPFWCPVVKEDITGDKVTYPARKSSAMSDAQLSNWEKAKRVNEAREKWLSAPGLTAWDDIKLDTVYHLPPTLKKGRMDIVIKKKYVGSVQAVNIKTNDNVWLYKEDEEYKYMSVAK